MRGLYSEAFIYGGKFAFQIEWASLIVGSKITVFALFYFVFEGNFPSTRPRGAYIWRRDLAEGFFALPVWGSYIWRGLFSKFYGIPLLSVAVFCSEDPATCHHPPPSLVKTVKCKK